MAVSAVQNDAAASLVNRLNQVNTPKTASATSEMSDRFLKLLVTQLKNQDPMNPMENAELTSQLAQMSTVEGINKMNASLDGLVAQFKSNQVMQGAALVGRQVLVEGEALALNSVGGAGGFNLATAADNVKVNIFNADGAAVRTLDLGAQQSGLTRFVWDGQDTFGESLPEGDYSFRVDASTLGKSVSTTAYGLGSVLSVALDGSDMAVEIAGMGARRFDQIRQIF